MTHWATHHSISECNSMKQRLSLTWADPRDGLQRLLVLGEECDKGQKMVLQTFMFSLAGH